jgi:hypothetical protein
LLTKLEQSAWALIATVALSAAAFGVLPSTAEAQEMPSAEADRGANEPPAPHPVVVEPASAPATHPTLTVNPGDSLWSVVQERLDPEALPQQIALEVDRIYELNQDRIGGDPNLIFPGQEFLVPPTLTTEPDASAARPQTGRMPLASEEPATAAAASPAPSEEAPLASEPPTSEGLARSEGPAISEEASTPPQPVASEGPATPEQAAEPVNDPASQSNNAPTDEETAPPLAGIADPLIEFLADPNSARRLLGVEIIVLTVLVAILMARKLPMTRGVDGPVAGKMSEGDDQERPPTAEGVEDDRSAPASEAPEPARRGSGDPVGTEEAEPALPMVVVSRYNPSLAAQKRPWERLRRTRQRTPLRRRGEEPRTGGEHDGE